MGASELQVRLERVGYATGRGRKEDGKPFVTSVTIIFFLKQVFAKLHFRLKRSFCKDPENIAVKTKRASNSPVLFVTHRSFAVLSRKG